MYIDFRGEGFGVEREGEEGKGITGSSSGGGVYVLFFQSTGKSIFLFREREGEQERRSISQLDI